MHSYVTNPNAMHETIDGETIVIDLASGTYYSLRGSGPAIWNALASGSSRDAIVERLAAAYEAPREEIAGAAEAFLARLEEEQLIVHGNGAGPDGDATLDHAGPRGPFEPPELERYDDLQDIILLDPVHMVDDQGWPHRSPSGKESE